MYWHYGCQFAADMAQRHSAIPAAKPHTAFTVTLWQLDWGPYPRCWLLLQQHSWATKNGVNGRGRVCGGVRACSGGPAVGPIAPAVGVHWGPCGGPCHSCGCRRGPHVDLLPASQHEQLQPSAPQVNKQATPVALAFTLAKTTAQDSNPLK